MTVRTGDTGNVAVHEALNRRKYQTQDHKHPVNVIHHERATFGEQLADGIASFIGSWRFLITQTLLVATWVTINTLQVTGKIHIDPYPYILLNLAFSTQAAYTGPVLLLAGNRQSQKDRLTLEHAAHDADDPPPRRIARRGTRQRDGGRRKGPKAGGNHPTVRFATLR